MPAQFCFLALDALFWLSKVLASDRTDWTLAVAWISPTCRIIFGTGICVVRTSILLPHLQTLRVTTPCTKDGAKNCQKLPVFGKPLNSSGYHFSFKCLQISGYKYAPFSDAARICAQRSEDGWLWSPGVTLLARYGYLWVLTCFNCPQ